MLTAAPQPDIHRNGKSCSFGPRRRTFSSVNSAHRLVAITTLHSLLCRRERNLGQWHHVAGVYSHSGGFANLYVDGVLKGTTPSNGPLTHDSSDLRFGNWSGCCEDFDGIIDEVRIWNVARTEQQIQNHMDLPLVGNEPGLVGYWRFDERSGQLVTDSSIHGNDG